MYLSYWVEVVETILTASRDTGKKVRVLCGEERCETICKIDTAEHGAVMVECENVS